MFITCLNVMLAFDPEHRILALVERITKFETSSAMYSSDSRVWSPATSFRVTFVDPARERLADEAKCSMVRQRPLVA